MLFHRSLVAAAAASCWLLFGTARTDAEPVRVMTFNIRYATAPDGDNVWTRRSDLVTKVIRDFEPAVLGVQEALRNQVDELAEALPEYAKVGVGREADGSGEYSAIYFHRARFDLMAAGTIWLSGTPEIPGSRTWGNTLPRIATWVRLHDRSDERNFVVLNTHWDHQSQPAREESGKLICQRIGELSQGGEPALVMGDFNVPPTNQALLRLIDGGKLRDTFRVVHPEESDVSTFNGFGSAPASPKIDSILASSQWKVDGAEIVRTRDGERFPSDHYPVTATVELPKVESAP